jgi:hypothetical protein
MFTTHLHSNELKNEWSYNSSSHICLYVVTKANFTPLTRHKNEFNVRKKCLLFKKTYSKQLHLSYTWMNIRNLKPDQTAFTRSPNITT